MDTKNIVRARLTTRDLLEQLAEECAELAQAALKVIRANGMSANATPITAQSAYSKIVEESGDVLMLLDLLRLADIDTSDNPKWERWAARLEAANEQKDC